MSSAQKETMEFVAKVKIVKAKESLNSWSFAIEPIEKIAPVEVPKNKVKLTFAVWGLH